MEYWENNYINFLAEKTEWINTQYVYATNAGNIELLKNSKTDIDAVLSKALTLLDDSIAKESDKENIQKMVNESLETLVNGDMLNNLMSMVDSIGVSSKNTGKTVNNAVRKNLSSIDSFISALKVQDSITTEIKNKAAILAAQQAETTIAKMVKSFMDRIDAENASVRAWQENLVRNDGYTYGNTIEREVIVDASYANAKKEKQTIRKYKDFKTAAPDVKVEFGQDETESTIMRKIKEAQEKLTLWDKNIFGETEIVKTSEGKEYETTVYYDVSRETAATKNIELYKKEDKENSNKKEENNEDAGKNLVSVRDGVFGEYLGYGPKFKDKDVDFTKSAESNIEKQGSGQYGEILLDFQWNSMKFNYGLNQLSMPVYDKKLWLSDSFFEPPTIRSVASLVCDIAGSATGQSWWLGILDDALFASLDIVVEDKDVGEVATEFGKAALTNTISVGLGAASNGLSALAGNISNTAAKVATQAAISASSAYISQVSNSYINALSYSAENGWSMDWDNANNSWFSNDTLAATLGAGISTGINVGIDTKLSSLHDNGAAIQKFYGSAIDLGISAISKASEFAVYTAYAKGDFKQAFEDMGGLTFNIANLGAFADMLATGFARTNNSGQAGKLGTIAQKLCGTGILEINIGSNGLTSKFGTGGIDLAGNLYTFTKRMNDKFILSNFSKQENISQIESETAFWSYIYGDSTQENTAARIANGIDKLNILDNIIDGALAHTIQNNDASGRLITITNTGDLHLNTVLLGHEAYRDGIVNSHANQVSETFNAVLGHTKMAAYMNQYGTNFCGLLDSEIKDYNNGNFSSLMLDSLINYDSSSDYWRVLSNGDLYDDGLDDRVSFEDGRDTIYYGKKSKQGTLEKFLGLESGTGYMYLLKESGYSYTDGKWTINTEKNSNNIISYEKISDLLNEGLATNNYQPQQNIFEKSIVYIQNVLKTKYGSSTERDKLKEKQESVIRDENYQQGSQGPFGFLEATSETTWCNMATQEVTFETSYELSMALRNENDPYCENTNANDMYDNLMKAAQNPNSSIVEITPQQAQVLANQGYTVVGSWKNSNPDLSGHIATVEAGHEYKPETGPYFGNVGSSEYTGTGQTAYKAFGQYNYQSIKYYYDKEQFKNRRWY